MGSGWLAVGTNGEAVMGLSESECRISDPPYEIGAEESPSTLEKTVSERKPTRTETIPKKVKTFDG